MAPHRHGRVERITEGPRHPAAHDREPCPHAPDMPEHGKHRLAPHEHLLRAIGGDGHPEDGIDTSQLRMPCPYANAYGPLQRGELQRRATRRALMPQHKLHTAGAEPALSVVQ